MAKRPERLQAFQTLSDQEMRRLYTPADVPDLDYERDLGFPGQYPFTRGVQPTMYRGRLWTMRQFAGFGSAEETNERYKYLLANGQTGLSVAFDFPTLMGFDSDHPLSRGEVGKCGVAIDSLRDMEILFDGIPLEEVSTSMTINHPGPILLAMYLAVAEKQGVRLGPSWAAPCRTTSSRSSSPRSPTSCPPSPACASWSTPWSSAPRRCPSGTRSRSPATTSGRRAPPRQQELAFTLADGIAYVEAAIEAGPRRGRSSRPGSRSSSTPTWTSSRRSPSSAPPGGCGPAS